MAAAALAVSASVAVTSASASSSITEAGSSLVYPLAAVWAQHYSAATVSTAAGGSSTGIADIQTNSKDIGASDAPMTSTQWSGDSHGPVEIPWALSATGIGYNIAGVGGGLRLTPTIIAEIYTGKITTWGNKAITKINPHWKKQLSKAGKITPVFRSDGSGDSYAFQNFMYHAVPKIWTTPASTSFPTAVGLGENGNAGVAGVVRVNKGTIGYISAAYLIQQNIHTAAVQNAAGNYETPNAPNIADAAMSNSTVPAQNSSFDGVSIVWPSKKYKTAYPVSTYTYAIVNSSSSNIDTVKAFLQWVISPTGGQRYGASLDFVPLPAGIRNADNSIINGL